MKKWANNPAGERQKSLQKKSPEGFRPPGFYQFKQLCMIRSLKVSGIRGFDVEQGIVGIGGVGDVGHCNGKGTGGFDFG